MKDLIIVRGGGDLATGTIYKLSADNDCSHEIKRRLLLGRKAMTNLTY